MATCNRCQKEIGLLGRLNFNQQTGRCGKCEIETRKWLDQFRSDFNHACSDGVLTGEEWARLTSNLAYSRINQGEALAFVRGDALHFIEHTMAFAFADGQIEVHEEKNINYLLQLFEIPPNLARPIQERLAYLKYISQINLGHLPTIRASIYLESDEICHMEMAATYHKVNAKSISYVDGRLVATSKKLHFLSGTGGAEIPWKRIMRVSREAGGVYLELSTKKANGHYDVDDPILAEAVINTLVRMSKRQLIAPQSDVASRHIPQDVKQAVWQRDQERCVECRADTYLEFDHIIPFSKGGASSVGNVQLLCRRCNLVKSSKI